MKTIIIAFLSLIFTSISFSQPEDVMINPFWYFYSNNHLDAVSSGMGGTGIASVGTLSSVFLNPASLEINGKYQANLQYSYKSNQTWLEILGINDLYIKHNINSVSAGFGYRINKNFQAGFIYSNPKSMTFNVGEVIQTNEFGEEIGRYEAYDKYTQYAFTLPVVYSIEKLRLGLSLIYTLHRRNYNFFDNDESVAKLDRFTLQGGLIFQPMKEFSAGVNFKSEASGDVEHINSQGINTQTEKAILPMEFGAGAQYTLKNGMLRFAADYSYVNGSKLEGQKDQHSFHFGTEYNVNKNWQVRTGFFTQPDPRDLSANYVNENESYDQVFLTFGATYRVAKASFTLAVMDSHISSGVLKYTYVNGGVNLDF